MTPKEKAKELIDKFKKISVEIEEKDSIYHKRIGLENAERCALICIDEKNELLERIHSTNRHLEILYELKRELVGVKQEILKQ